MKKPSLRLMCRLFFIFTGVAFFGVIMITLNNLYINGFSWEELVRFNLKAKLLIALLLVITFPSLSFLRLREVFRLIDKPKQMQYVTRVWRRLLLFPHEVFWAMLVFGAIVSPAYHLIDFWRIGKPVFHWGREEILLFMRDFLFDQSLTLTLAVLFYSLIRHTVRIYLVKMPTVHLEKNDWKASFMRPLLITFISIVLITIFSMMWYIINSIVSTETINLTILLGITLFAFLFGLILFLLLANEFRGELQYMIRGIRSLIGGDRLKLHSKMPIISRDEAGQLAAAFNELQSYIAKSYQDLEYELHLAYKVQQNLLPKENLAIGACQIYASSQPMKEIGGDLYDIYILDNQRFALLIGDVSGKGISAALLMSAMMLLFKTEMRRGGSAGEILTRLNQLMAETLRGEMYITLGLAIFDQNRKWVEYASAGHLSPYLIRDGKIEQILISSVPLGFSSEEEYHEVRIPFQPKDRLIFYTDGVIEKADEHGRFIGFDRFEQFLLSLDEESSLEEQFHRLQELLGEKSAARYEDDRTLIMVRWEKREEESYLAKAGERANG